MLQSKLHGQMEDLHSALGEHGEDEDEDEDEEDEMDEQVAVAPVPGDRSASTAVMVNTKDTRGGKPQRVVIDRKNIKNYPSSDGWKEVSPGMREETMAEDKGKSGYNKFKQAWRAKHGDKKPVPGYDSKEYTQHIYQQNDKKRSVAEGIDALKTAASMAKDYIITAEVDGKTKKFRVRGVTGERSAKEKFLKHASMAKIIDVKAESVDFDSNSSNLDEAAAPSIDAINKALGSTTDSKQGLAALMKAFKVDEKGAKAMMKKALGEEVDLDEGWDDMMKMVQAKAKEKGTGNFDKKKVSTGTVYTRKTNKDGTSKGAVNEKLHPNQKKLDVDGDGKIEKSDFEKLRKGKKPGTTGKAEQIDTQPKMNEGTQGVAEGKTGAAPGWMLRADPELAKKIKANKELAKKRRESYGDPSKGISAKKEEIDFLDELLEGSEMTDDEMKKREKIVKSMKKKTADFKSRYGDRWKSVMYATATKMANK
jgi:hypothetical protein